MRVVSSVSFLSPAEVAQLATSTGIGQSSSFIKRQSQFLGFLQALGSRIGFPLSTISIAQLLFLRFYLFYSPNEFMPHEVAIACTVVASKMNDTPKKPREVVLNSWALRFPEMVRTTPNVKATATNKGVSDTTGNIPSTQLGLGIISESDVDSAAVEKERKRAVSIENLILQSITFNFNVHVRENFRLVIKISRAWDLDEEFAKLAWQIVADCHRTYAPLSYPPSAIALAGIYCASLLYRKAGTKEHEIRPIIDQFKSLSAIELAQSYCTAIECVEEIVHALLDLYSATASSLSSGVLSSSATPISPATPASPAEPTGTDESNSSNNNRKLPSHIFSPPPFGILFWLNHILGGVSPIIPSEIVADITQIKIWLRQKEDDRIREQEVENFYPSSAPPLIVSSQIVRPFDKGGVLGDIEKPMTSESIDQLLVSWQERDQDKQFSSLQRFLF